jgi:hypothetical protein
VLWKPCIHWHTCLCSGTSRLAAWLACGTGAKACETALERAAAQRADMSRRNAGATQAVVMHNRHLLTSFVRLEKQARQPLNVSALLYISPAHESLWFSPYMPPPPPPPPPGPRDPAWTVPELRRRALQLQRPVTALLHDMSVLREFLAGIDRRPQRNRPVILIRNSVQVLAATCGRAQSSSSVSGGDSSGLLGGVKEAPTRFCRTLARQARQLVAQGELSLLMAESPSAQPSLRWACPHTGQVRSVGAWACAAWEVEVTAAAARTLMLSFIATLLRRRG